MEPGENKFHQGNGEDGKHYWLTPPDLMETLDAEFEFDFDACPYPLPEGFDGLTCEWGDSTYANIPFGSVLHEGKKKGPTAWMRKAIEENRKGKRAVVVFPVDKWILMMLAAGATVRNLGDVRWCAIEDGSPGKGTGRHVAAFILEPPQGEPTMTAVEIDEALDVTLARIGLTHLVEQSAALKLLRAELGALIEALHLIPGHSRSRADLETALRLLNAALSILIDAETLHASAGLYRVTGSMVNLCGMASTVVEETLATAVEALREWRRARAAWQESEPAAEVVA